MRDRSSGMKTIGTYGDGHNAVTSALAPHEVNSRVLRWLLEGFLLGGHLGSRCGPHSESPGWGTPSECPLVCADKI